MPQSLATEDFLGEIDVAVPRSLTRPPPSRRTVVRRLDEFLDEEGRAQNDFCVGWSEWTSKQDLLSYVALSVTGTPDDYSLAWLTVLLQFP